MDKETMSSYGLILITVLLMSVLILLTTPIGNAVMEDLNVKAETIVNNSGIFKDSNSAEYVEIQIRYRYSDSGRVLETREIKARSGTNQIITHPEMKGHDICMDKYGSELAKTTFLIEHNLYKGNAIDIYYVPKTYTVSYDLNGGTFTSSPTILSYKYGSSYKLPDNIIKEGYMFVGWYEDSGLGGDRVYSITQEDIGNKTFYAKFSKK